MRHLVLLLALGTLGGCVPRELRSGPPPAAEVADDGKTVRVAGEAWVADEGLTFFLRGSSLHVVSVDPGQPFDVVVTLAPGAPLSIPASAPFVVRGRTLHLASAEVPPAFAELLRTGQLHLHEEHAHLTHLFRDPNWQALYALRAEGSAVEPLRRRIAALLLAELLEVKLPAAGGEASERGLQRIVETIATVRRGFEAGLGAGQLEGIVDHGYELRDGGKVLTIGGSAFQAAEGLRFAYCTGHLHVEDASDRWAQIVTPAPQQAGVPFAFPPSLFFEVSRDGIVSRRQGPSRPRELLENGQLRYTHGHVHLTERYENAALVRLLAAMDDASLADAARSHARSKVLELLRLRFELGTGEQLDTQLEQVDRLLEQALGEVEAMRRTPPPPTRGSGKRR